MILKFINLIYISKQNWKMYLLFVLMIMSLMHRSSILGIKKMHSMFCFEENKIDTSGKKDKRDKKDKYISFSKRIFCHVSFT